MLGGTIRYATPKKHEPEEGIIKQAKSLAQKSGAKILGFNDPKEAVKDADVVYTDVWVSMGQESSRSQKLKEFDGMQVNEELVKYAKKDAVFMHCLPAYRGNEVSAQVIDGPQSVVFQEAENRLHVQKALMLFLLDSQILCTAF